MTLHTTGPRPAPGDRGQPPPDAALDGRMQSLADAADAAVLAPSVHGSQPWVIVLHHDRLDLRADRSRQLAALDPDGRELVQSLGAALFNVRVALAARGWAVDVDRFPDPADADVAAVVRPVPGVPETRLPLLAEAVEQRRTHRAGFLAEEVPDELLEHLGTAAAAEDSGLLAVLSEESRRLVARLTQEADAAQLGDPACGADLQRWRHRSQAPRVGARTTGEPSDLPARTSRRTVDSDTGVDRSYVVITSRTDDPVAWLRSGEALERVLLELTRLGWVASPMTQALEVPSTRAQLRSAITGGAYPQMLLRVGFSEPAAPRRERHGDGFAKSPSLGPRPVSDGRGGTTWL